MNVRLSRAILTISIDLELDATRLGLAERRSLDEITFGLLDLLAKYEMPATWAVADPAVSAASERVASLNGAHEIALFGDGTWVGHEAGRSRFGRELVRRAERARAAGFAASTLVIKNAQLDDHADLAIKHGITAVRHVESLADLSARMFRPQMLRYGLWSFPVSCNLPGPSRWLLGGGGGKSARGLVDQAIKQCGLLQLAIDAPRLAARGYAALQVLKRVLAHAERRRQQGLLSIATGGVTANRLSPQQGNKPSQSILHPAA